MKPEFSLVNRDDVVKLRSVPGQVQQVKGQNTFFFTIGGEGQIKALEISRFLSSAQSGAPCVCLCTPLLNGPISKNREQRSGILNIVRDP